MARKKQKLLTGSFKKRRRERNSFLNEEFFLQILKVKELIL